MTDTNAVILIGRLTRDLTGEDYAYTNSGIARARISIAVNRSVKKNEQWIDEVSYFDITLWGKTAENLKPYLLKGKQIAVTGVLKQDRWEKDGQKNSKITIIAENVQLLGSKGEGGNSPAANSEQSQSKQAFSPKSQEQQQTFGEDFPEDIPF